MFALIDHINEVLSIENIKNSINKALNDDATKDYIIYLNTEKQLYESGVNSENIDLRDIGGDYAISTKIQKQIEGQPIDRVTLKDYGDFYNTFEVEIEPNNDIIIDANPIKENDNLFNRWGVDVLGLTDSSIEQLNDLILPKIIENIL